MRRPTAFAEQRTVTDADALEAAKFACVIAPRYATQQYPPPVVSEAQTIPAMELMGMMFVEAMFAMWSVLYPPAPAKFTTIPPRCETVCPKDRYLAQTGPVVF